MSGLFRSETMSYARLVMQDETAYATAKEIGNFGKAHIVDLSLKHATQAPDERTAYFKKRVATCGFYERKFANFRSLFDQYHVAPPSIDIEPQPLQPVVGDTLEAVRTFIEPLESTLTKNVLYAREQRIILNALQERLYVIQVVSGTQIGIASLVRANSRGGPQYGTFAGAGEQASLLRGDEEDDEDRDVEQKRTVPQKQHFMRTLYGVIPEDRVALFERMIFRLSRGNVVTKITSIPEPMEDPLNPGHLVRKAVFTLTFVGEILEKRLKKVIQHFNAVEYEVPADMAQRGRLLTHLATQISDAQAVLKITNGQVQANLKGLCWDQSTGSSPYIDYMYALKVEKSVCDTLKKCELERLGSSMLKMELWLPEEDIQALQQALIQSVEGTGTQPPVCEILSDTQAKEELHTSPPTYFKVTKFTSPYQGIVDTYGTPRYKEVNPGLFTIISFPFLFGVMYGDIGHGSLLTLGAMWFIYNESYYNRLQRYGQMDEILGMIYGGRYMLILMGLFAVYAGFIYNDCFSIPFNLFGTSWSFPTRGSDEPAVQVDAPYLIGIDPSWYHTVNELAFFNSLKMKLAVTLGVVQMTFGIILGACNNIYFKDRLALMFEFLPRLTFMLCTFGYMIFLIIYKLSIDWSVSPVAPPNLVQTMIAMFLSPGTVEADKQLYPGQAGIQLILLFLALGSVPVMLLAQPLIARAEHNALFGTSSPSSTVSYTRVGGAHHHGRASVREESKVDDEEGLPLTSPKSNGEVIKVDATAGGGGGSGDDHGGDPRSPHYDFSNHAIIQGIHTIEFVLGAVSNTASYLRLWALSLAHAELSDVFWKKMISQYGLESGSPILMVIGMAGWAGATFAVLLAMDVLECFLHALRLHWVEFQNKFYHADGYPYRPFSFETSDVQE